MASNVVDRIDAALGRAIENVIVSHHRRRLTKVEWQRALAPGAGPWAAGSPPPRPGNAVEILIDGSEILKTISDEIRAARSYVHITGWHLNPGFTLEHGAPDTILRDLLDKASAGVDVRVLLWGGAPLGLFKPSRRAMREVRERLLAGGRVKCVLDLKERPMHCHHDKTIVIDDHVAFVGGLDLTDLGGDRLDSSEHPARAGVGWHDAAVRLEGPVVRDVSDRFRLRWSASTGESLAATPGPAEVGTVTAQVVGTVPDGMYDALPGGDFRILESYLLALRSARRLIYIENQFLWSPEIMSVLRDQLRQPPSDAFRMVLLLPAKPNNGGDDTRGHLSTLLEADAGGGRVLACTLLSPNGADGNPVYVHAKIGIVDDAWITVGSANLNEHSLFNDTEMNIVIRDAVLVRKTRLRLWAEHLEKPVSEIDGDTTEVIDRLWKTIAANQAWRRENHLPATHRLTLLSQLSKRAGLLLGPLQGLTVDA